MKLLNTFNLGMRFLCIPPKILLIVKLIIVIMTTCLLQVSAGSFAQRLTYVKSDVTIKQVFKAITQQTGYEVLYADKNINDQQKINVDFKNTPLTTVLDKILKEQNVTYSIDENKGILIQAKAISLVDRVSNLFQQEVTIRVNLKTAKGEPLPGGAAYILGTDKSFRADEAGIFFLKITKDEKVRFSYVGYQTKDVLITLADGEKNQGISVVLELLSVNLKEVVVGSNGYQKLDPTRTTGSIEVITKEQLQHSTDPNLIRRLEGITTAMDFRNDLSPNNSAYGSNAGTANQLVSRTLGNLTIRGKNTLNPSNLSLTNLQSGTVLVVVDGVPSPYNVDNINPSDVENVTILKDAAAASIWGARAANGVIVIETKRGKYNQPFSISFNSNFNITNKIDLFYKKQMSTSDYIDAQAFLFKSSFTSIGIIPNVINAPLFYSPVAEILGSQKRGEITQVQADAQLNALRGNDVRRDFEKYIQRDRVVQSYSVGIEGGSQKMSYRLSAGYDNTQNNSVNSNGSRLTLNYNASINPIKNLNINAGVTFLQAKSNDQTSEELVTVGITPYFPYTRLADDQGNPLSVPYTYRPAFVKLLAQTYGSKIQDLTFTPLENINEGYIKANIKNLNLVIGADYKLNDVISANVVYNYNMGFNVAEKLNKQNSFFMRNLITTFTKPDGTKQIPMGGRYQNAPTDTHGQTLRGQLNVNKNWGDKHELVAIAGQEFSDSYVLDKSNTYYGYDEKTLTSNNQLDYSKFLPALFGDYLGRNQVLIPGSSNIANYRSRIASSFANAAYTYNQRYTISASVRKDLTNFFGKNTNKRGAPFYSFGGNWNIAREDFYNLSLLPILQLRTTFGYNGNVNSSVLPYTMFTAIPSIQDNGVLSISPTGDGYFNNDQLRPEKTGVLNFGLDFGFKNARVYGSIDYYRKSTKDLIAGNPLDPSTGSGFLSYNIANLKASGIDFALNSKNLQIGLFNWTSTFLFSHNRVRVEKVFRPQVLTAQDLVNASPAFNEGADLSRLYAYPWGGLDPETGSPIGFVSGQPKVINNDSDASEIMLQPMSGARYIGSSVPVFYGSFRNTFSYASFSVSVNMMYKLGYFFRRPISDVVQYSTLFRGGSLQAVQGVEYAQRWQKRGDEAFTNVPSQTYPASFYRDQFYQNAEINVQKADHVRIQEINLSYVLNTNKSWFIKNPRIYANISNLGIIWRANKLGLDPDIFDYPNPRTYSFGLSANF